MTARAPGKIVISGAYAVLSGAPAIVCAVDRYVVADAGRAAERVTPEVKAALGDARAPWFDASALREGDKKLGLGSSAAILVASLAARLVGERGALGDRELADLVLAPALAAHAAAQQGGSGVDVAAAALGGTLVFRRDVPREARPIALPQALHVEIWWTGVEASTPALVSRVFALQGRDEARFSSLLGAQCAAAESAERALSASDAAGLVVALAAQRHALSALGEAAGAPIVTASAQWLADAAEREGAAALPAGAGGGDVLIYAGQSGSSTTFRNLAEGHGHRRLDLTLGARGVHTWLKGTA